MAFALFLVPSVGPADRAAVWQLQLLADAHGFAVRTSSARTALTSLSAADQAAIRQSDAVLAIVTAPPGAHALAEIRFARRARKPVLALVEQGVGLPPELASSLRAVAFTRGEDISRVASPIMERVRTMEASKEARTAVAWLLVVGVALFTLGLLAKSTD